MRHTAPDSEAPEQKEAYQAHDGGRYNLCHPENAFEVAVQDGQQITGLKDGVTTTIIEHTASMKDHTLLQELLALWNNSVRATHSFLSEEAINNLKPFVLEALEGIAHLYVAYRGKKPIAFMGISGEKIEMLFVSPCHFRQGLGKLLVGLAIKKQQAIHVDVNEQNPQAKAFYEHLNFEMYERTETDNQGNPYPILKMVQKNIFFNTERLVIRSLNIKDVETLHTFMGRKEVMNAWEHGFTKQEVREWINQQIYRYFADGTGYWGVALREDPNMLIGQAGLLKTELEGKEVTELGYIFNDAYWHQGYAHEAALCCLHHAFHILDLDEVYCTIRPNNKHSIRLAKRLGMVQCGALSKLYRGKELAHTIYKIKQCGLINTTYNETN